MSPETLVQTPVKESQERLQKLAAIIVLGKNWEGVTFHEPKVQPNLSYASRLNVEAAAILYRAGHSDTVIFSGGKTAGQNYLSEAEAMEQHFLKSLALSPKDFHPEISVLEDGSIDTADNAEKVLHILQELHIDPSNIAIVSTSFHLNRANPLFTSHGIPPKALFASEQVIAAYDAQRRKEMQKYTLSFAYRYEQAVEFGLNLVLPLDPQGQGLRKITRLIRHA